MVLQVSSPTTQEQILSILPNSFRKQKRGNITSTCFYKVSIIFLKQKKKKFTHENRSRNPKQNPDKLNSYTLHQNQVKFILEMQG